MSDLHDEEYLDTLQAMYLKGRRRTPDPPKSWQRVDRQSPRWLRMRSSLCEQHGLGDESLDEYCDRVYRLIPR